MWLRKNICIYGCFSPYGSPPRSPQPDMLAASKSNDVNVIMAPMLQISPEPHKLCGKSSVILSIEVGSLEALAVATMPLAP
jgi:hypothetical protein